MKHVIKYALYILLSPLEDFFNCELEWAYDYYSAEKSGSNFLHRRNRFTGEVQLRIRSGFGNYYEWV
jgi:hypothetical protein